MGLKPATKIRTIDASGYHIVSGVFGAALPYPSWQGNDGTLAMTYVFSSLVKQCMHGVHAHSYTVGDC